MIRERDKSSATNENLTRATRIRNSKADYRRKQTNQFQAFVSTAGYKFEISTHNTKEKNMNASI